MRRGVADELEARHPWVGLSSSVFSGARSDADVVRLRRIDLLRGMGRLAGRNSEPPSRTQRNIVLAEVHEVRLTEQRQVGPVVDDERHSEPARHLRAW